VPAAAVLAAAKSAPARPAPATPSTTPSTPAEPKPATPIVPAVAAARAKASGPAREPAADKPSEPVVPAAAPTPAGVGARAASASATPSVSVIEKNPKWDPDDGFLDELRKAVDDETPLGPPDEDADRAMQAFFEQGTETEPKRTRFGRKR
jgi:hypothetical protein